MTGCGMPELGTKADIEWMLEKLVLEKSEIDAASYFERLIDEALHTKTTVFNDAAHSFAHA